MSEITTDQLNALMAGNSPPITDSMAVSILKSPVVQKFIQDQIAAAADTSPPEG